jgi:ABC-type antimicrobial peptide transport system permease subunit
MGFNVIGLSIAFAFAILSYFNYTTDANYDANHKNGIRLYRVSSVREFEGDETPFGIVPSPLYGMVRYNMPDVTKATRYSHSYSYFKINDNIFNAELAYADSSFFGMFTFEFLEGDARAFFDKKKVMLSDEMSLKLFNTTKSVGNPLTLLVGEEKKELLVGAVYKKPPLFSSFNSAAYLNYENYRAEFKSENETDWQYRNSLFVQIDNPEKVPQVEKQLQAFRENNNKVRTDFQINRYNLDPFQSMARHDSEQRTQQIGTRPAGPRSAVFGNILSAVLILLLACLNLTNTSTAISSTRLKEIGIRKVMGSERKHLIAQFLGETFIIACVSLFLGLQLAEFFLEGWNAMWPWVKLEIHYFDQPYFMAFLVVVVLAATVMAGGYPAFYISRFQTASVLKGKMKFGGTNYFMRTLLVLQFCIAVIGIIFAVAFVQNAKFQQAQDLGFNQTDVIFSRMSSYEDYKTYRDALEKNKDVLAVAGSKHHLFYSTHGQQPVKFESNQLQADLLEVDADYRNAMGFTLVAGRDFVKDSETDRSGSVLVTQNLVKEFHWDSPIGKEIILSDTVKLTVVGVLKDVYTHGLWFKMEPMVLRLAPKESSVFLVVNAPREKIQEVKASMEKEWKQLFPDCLFSAHTMDETISETLTVNSNLVIMFSFMGLVSILLSSTGLFALVALNIVKRMKEIGVRKVLGASVAQITLMINREFFLILIFSFLGGCVASYYLANGLLGAIWEYYQPTSVFTFGAAGLALLGIAGGTILVKVYRAASINPVETLKDE